MVEKRSSKSGKNTKAKKSTHPTKKTPSDEEKQLLLFSKKELDFVYAQRYISYK